MSADRIAIYGRLKAWNYPYPMEISSGELDNYCDVSVNQKYEFTLKEQRGFEVFECRYIGGDSFFRLMIGRVPTFELGNWCGDRRIQLRSVPLDKVVVKYLEPDRPEFHVRISKTKQKIDFLNTELHMDKKSFWAVVDRDEFSFGELAALYYLIWIAHARSRDC